MFKKFTPLIAILVAIFIAGCGSSGKPGVIPPLQPLSITKKVPANTTETIVVDDVTVNISPTALAQPSTLTVFTEQTTEKPSKANISLAAGRANVTISSSSMPQDKIVVTISGLNRSRFDVGRTFYGFVQKTENGWDSVTDFVEATGDKVEVIADQTAFTFMNGIAVFKGIITKVTIVSPIEDRGLVEMATDLGTYSANRVLIMVPGFNNSIDGLNYAASKFASMHKYRKIYGFSYDYRKSANVPAKALGETLDSLADQSQDIDLLGHSRGGLICRAALENYSKTRRVINFYSICTPHEGVEIANVSKLMKYLRDDYLNSTADTDQPFGILAFDTEATDELFPDCSFIRKLNDPDRILFPGHVNYYIVGTDRSDLFSSDQLAGGDTGLAKNVPLEKITAGAVNRYFLAGNTHTSLLKTPEGIDKLIGTVMQDPAEVMNFYVTPTDVFFNIITNRWKFTSKFENIGPNPVKIIDMMMDAYDKDGKWIETEWYDPTTPVGVTYPQEYYLWNKSMPINSVLSIPISQRTDANETPYNDPSLDPRYKAGTASLSIRYQDQATLHVYAKRIKVRLMGVNDVPTEPVWRSASRAVAHRGGTLSPDK
jgi:pimeloyl-ACP methyl ester carboxylesterase